MLRKFLPALILLFPLVSQGQYKVLHAFGSGSDGGGLWGNLIFDSQGNLYGTTSGGGAFNGGTVFELTPQSNGEWAETVLHNFPSSADDGAGPIGGVIFDPAGNLYGTTQAGGDGRSHPGTVFELTPGLGGWTETVLYSFCILPGCRDGGDPWGSLTMDKAGNLYGTAGVAFELSSAPGGWTEEILHDFTGQNGDGFDPRAGPITDSAGNLCGTTSGGGGLGRCTPLFGCGTVYELQPNPVGIWASGVEAWRERILHRFPSFPNDAKGLSLGQLAMDSFGDLYGTAGGGTYGFGTIFKLTRPPIAPEGVWVETVLYSFQEDANGYDPGGGVVLDQAGNLYGTTTYGGSPLCGCGVVYELTPQPDGTWQYTLLHTFVGFDGAQPDANLTIGPDGNLYGTTITGGAGGAGVVFQIQIAP
jgi:uncharacterized repeat protein (TIGR03803 family)